MDTEERLDALEVRVAALEADAKAQPATVAGPVDGDDRFWALHALRERLAPPGGVVFAGSVDLPTGSNVVWQWGETTPALLDRGWDGATDRLTALAHPVRIELLRHVLLGRRTTAELAGLDVMGTTGQLYHHLRQLVAAGWLRQAGRGNYEVPADRVVPLLVLLSAARS